MHCAGWYGHDCARKKAGSLPPEPGRIERGAGWVTPVASTPVEVAAATAGATATTAGTTAATAIHATAATATAAAGGGGRVDVADGGIGVGADAAAPRLRKRPLIYVYGGWACVHRVFHTVHGRSVCVAS